MDRNKIKEEMGNFRKAPISITISVIILSFLVYLFLDKVVYKKQLENKDSQIELLERQLDIYKDKKYIVGETTFSRLSNTELKKTAKKKYDKLLETYLKYKSYDTIRLNRISSSRDWDKMMEIQETQSNFGYMMVNNYMNLHMVEIILIREQILLRLPKEEAKKSDLFVYQHPTNPLGYKDLLDDFNSLILKLPE
ncbi:MAG: hypothetical protein KDC09_01605 [Bacteroidales bacterium]|nr:hypothetical protein [Bacteroidales bacterium]